ncbi:unnamed protein product [Lactuca virosa]|uniref:Uncharacterized protein n=1 Tax=Lactuca virosa TaxID=75947 RepID=A0AAU9PHQ8_9ASTR|nr:unnamed protein product [Lactuca virosa]
MRSRFLNTKAAMNLHTDNATNSTCCVYDSDVAVGYGVGAFLFLLSGESLLMGVTKCMCFGRPLAPGGNRAWTIIYFTFSLLSIVVAEACLIAGAKKNALAGLLVQVYIGHGHFWYMEDYKFFLMASWVLLSKAT